MRPCISTVLMGVALQTGCHTLHVHHHVNKVAKLWANLQDHSSLQDRPRELQPNGRETVSFVQWGTPRNERSDVLIPVARQRSSSEWGRHWGLCEKRAKRARYWIIEWDTNTYKYWVLYLYNIYISWINATGVHPKRFRIANTNPRPKYLMRKI